MKRVNEILRDSIFKSCFQRIEALEAHRIFCKHGLSHSLDVARIAHMLNIQENLEYDKEIIYTTALLHDIGRADPEHDENHEEASACMALDFLQKYDYTPEEIDLIIGAIRAHRKTCTQKDDIHIAFHDLIFRADKSSRLCYLCLAQLECHWPDNQKNKELLL